MQFTSEELIDFREKYCRDCKCGDCVSCELVRFFKKYIDKAGKK